jgi:hypothetical protein
MALRYIHARCGGGREDAGDKASGGESSDDRASRSYGVATDKPLGAPYMSWGTLENLWERLDKGGVPPKIDRSILGGSEGYKTQVLAGLKWLGLIDNDGKVLPRMAQFIDEPARRQELVAQLFRDKYPKQIELGETNASQRDLEMSFQPLTGNTARKAVSFYLKGAKFADLPLSSYFITPRVRKASTGTGTTTKKRSATKKGAKQQVARHMRELVVVAVTDRRFPQHQPGGDICGNVELPHRIVTAFGSSARTARTRRR